MLLPHTLPCPTALAGQDPPEGGASLAASNKEEESEGGCGRRDQEGLTWTVSPQMGPQQLKNRIKAGARAPQLLPLPQRGREREKPNQL